MSERRRSSVHIPQGFEVPRSLGPSAAPFLDRTQFHALQMRKKRLLIVGGFFAAAYLVMVVQLFNLSVFNGDTSGGAVHHKVTKLDPGFRRDIVDRNAQLVATNLKTDSLYADARQILDAGNAARALMTVFPEFDFADLRTKLASGRAYVVLRHNLTPGQHASVHALGIPGFRFESRPHRVYPKGTLASHVVGFAGAENDGLIGLEKSLNEELVAADIKGPVELSLDLRIQYIVRDELMKAMIEFKAKAASGIVGIV